MYNIFSIKKRKVELIGKNIIHSGCLVYPIYQTCFKSENLSWSYGKDLSKKRLKFFGFHFFIFHRFENVVRFVVEGGGFYSVIDF